MRRQQEHVAGVDGEVTGWRPRSVEHAQDHGSLQLVKELGQRVVMEVGAVVPAADDGDDQVRIQPDLLVGDRRLEFRSVLCDPLFEVEWQLQRWASFLCDEGSGSIVAQYLVRMESLSGKRALVTGASRGIGLAIAEAFAAEGAVVYMAARSTDDLDAAAAEITQDGGTAIAIELDVTDTASIADAFDTIGASGGLDIAVLNAGVSPAPARVESSTADQWRSTFDVNVFGVVDTARAAIPLLKVNGGKIIVVGSGTGYQNHPGLGAYGASKAAVASVARTLAVELRGDNIAVNELIPGPVETALNPTRPNPPIWRTQAPIGSSNLPMSPTWRCSWLAVRTTAPSGQTFSLMGRLL